MDEGRKRVIGIIAGVLVAMSASARDRGDSAGNKVRRQKKPPEADESRSFSEQANRRHDGTSSSRTTKRVSLRRLKLTNSSQCAVISPAYLKISSAAVIDPNSTTINPPAAALPT
jgi:hypothetical protein